MGYSDISTRKAPLSRHPAFVPLIAVWLAALVGGCIAVLPTGMFSAGLAQVPFAIPAFAASQFAVAGLLAVIGAGLGFGTARAIHSLQHSSGRTDATIEQAANDTEQAETVDVELVEPLRVVEVEEVELEEVELEEFVQPVGESETVEAGLIEPVVCEDPAPESEQATDDSALEPAPFDDAPFYADIDLSQLRRKVEILSPANPNINVAANEKKNLEKFMYRVLTFFFLFQK